MIQDCPSFEKATQLFYSMQYEEGLRIINQCVSSDSRNSILYSNRALFYSQLGYVQQALSDLNLAIELNYLNYIAYFNMFSLLMRIERFDEAFQNLCCSLSCLYLIRAKNKKSQLDASRAIKYAENNMEAHVVKGLIHLQNGKYKLALNELDWACQINPSHEIVKNLRNLVFRKMNPGLAFQQNEEENDELNEKNEFIRLQSSYTIEQNSEKEKELRDRIVEFNEIYNNLNEYQGTMTTKVPKQEQIQDKLEPQVLENVPTEQQQYQKAHQVSEQIQQIQIEKQNPISKVYDQSHVKVSDHAENVQENTNEEVIHNQTQVNDDLIDEAKANYQNLTQQVAQELTQQTVVIDGQLVFQHPAQSSQSQKLTSRNSQAILADDGVATPSQLSLAPQPGQYGNYSESHSLYDSIKMEDPSMRAKQTETQTDKFSQFQSMIYSHNSSHIEKNHDHKADEENFESFIAQNDHQESQEISIISNALYPKPQNSMLQFSILKLDILNRSEQEIAEMNNLYCIANYLNVKQGASLSNFKLRTACQKGFNNGTQWNEIFDPIEIPESPECMKIKVYNKKYSSYRDDLIGEMEVQITTHGLVKLPLFNKKGELSGSLFMNLELVFPSIEEVVEQDES